MSELSGEERARYVQKMFTRIAPRYDFMNRLMTFGQDVHWRRMVIEQAMLAPGSVMLDLGAGTGDLAREALRRRPNVQVVAADFTLQMMLIGQQHTNPQISEWAAADACQLPFPDQTFHAVVSGFLLRNVTDLPRSLAEQYRVLKPGGRIVTLDTTPPPNTPLAPFIKFHLHTIIPGLGKLITGQADAYQYLPDTTINFLAPEILAGRIAAAGFTEVGFARLMFDTIAIHWGTK